MKTQFNQTTGILFLAVSIAIASCSEPKKDKELPKDTPVSVKVGTASQNSTAKITVSGQIEPSETAIISTRVMGFISSVKVKLGDRVEKGQLLVTINNGDILAKRAQALAMISEAEAALQDAQKDYERFAQLHKQQSASTKEFENVTLRYNSARAKTEAARQMKNETEEMLKYTNLIAPFSGVITQKNNDEGSMASPGMPILAIERADGYRVSAFVSEDEVEKISSGMDAEITIKSTGKSLNGRISEISPSSQFTGGQYQIKVSVPSVQGPGLFSGMYVNVAISMKNISAGQRLFVPSSAIVRRDQLSGLYTISENQTAQLRWLRVGKEYDGEVEIFSGLDSEERFIVQAEGKLYSGVPVLVK